MIDFREDEWSLLIGAVCLALFAWMPLVFWWLE